MCNLDYADNSYLKIYEAHPVAAWKQRCHDCGRTIVKGERYEVVVWSEWQPAENIDDDLAKPVGDQWRRAAETRRPGLRARPFTGGHHGSDMLVEFTRGTEMTAVACLQCLAAGRWVTEVCGGYMYATACQQLAEHWDEDSVYRCRDLARLVLYSGSRFDLCDNNWDGPSVQSCYHDTGPVVSRTREHPWTDRHGQLIAPWVIAHWVDQALTVYRSTLPTGYSWAA